MSTGLEPLKRDDGEALTDVARRVLKRASDMGVSIRRVAGMCEADPSSVTPAEIQIIAAYAFMSGRS